MWAVDSLSFSNPLLQIWDYPTVQILYHQRQSAVRHFFYKIYLCIYTGNLLYFQRYSSRKYSMKWVSSSMVKGIPIAKQVSLEILHICSVLFYNKGYSTIICHLLQCRIALEWINSIQEEIKSNMYFGNIKSTYSLFYHQVLCKK